MATHSLAFVCVCWLCLVEICGSDRAGQDHNTYVWAHAFCVAQGPDTYFMNVGSPGDKEWNLKQFKVPEGYAVITELSLPVFFQSKVQTNVSKGQPAFKECTKDLVANHALFGAILPNQGPPSLEFTLPESFDLVLDERKGKIKGKGKKGTGTKAFDPFHLMYPLYP